jgi:hypothetical protein
MPATSTLAARITRGVHIRLWSSAHANPWRALSAQSRAYDRAQLLVRVFYACGLFLAVQSMSDWSSLLNATDAAPPWPSAWIPAGHIPTFAPWILGGYAVAAGLSAALPTWRAARAVYFVAFLQYVSLTSGFGAISHYNHMWLWMSGILILLPDRRWVAPSTVEVRHYFLSTVWVGQLAVLFFYSLTGVWKIVFGLHGLVTERGSGFAIDGFSLIVAQRDLSFNDDAVLGDFFLHNHIVGWALFISTIYLELVSLAVGFRPRLHRAWGILLIAFHIGTELAMGFTFPGSVLLLAIFFVCSPFTPDSVPVREALLDLPGVFAARRLRRRRAVAVLEPVPATCVSTVGAGYDHPPADVSEPLVPPP